MKYDPQNERDCPTCGRGYFGSRRDHECPEPEPDHEDEESEET